jgi:arylsulfatase A-like enzyme/uncharacterized membrane protein YbhN (UPF0104 family)
MGEGARKWLRLGLKVAVSAAIISLIFYKIFQRQEADTLWAHVAELRLWLVALCAVSFGIAICANILRWNLLLKGQGIHAPAGYLASTFMIARFFGAAGGLIGQSGFRLYDLSRRTKKTARAAASIGIELVIGNMAMGLVSVFSCLFGLRYVGQTGVVMLALFFGALIAVTFTILAKPRFVRTLAQRLPAGIAARLQNAVDAVCAYEGKGGLLTRSVLLGVVIHVGNNMVYVLAAKALGVDLPIMELFFVSTLQNIVSHLPITPNGVGLREMTAVGLYTAVGLPADQAVLIPIVGFSVDMAISAMGGVLLLLRRDSYAPALVVDEAERESMLDARIDRAMPEEWPLTARGAALGAAAGILAGVCVGLLEAAAIVLVSHGQAEGDVWFFGSLTYGLLCGLGGAALGTASALSGRMMERRAVPEAVAFGHFGAGIAALFTLVLGAFRVQRDVFHEELVWKSARGLGVLLAALLSAALVYLLTSFVLSRLARHGLGRSLATPLGAAVFGLLVVGASLGYSLTQAGAAPLASMNTKATPAPSGSGNVLFVVVDTLRADHLPVYGYAAGKTPRLDAFARDALRFEQAYANASWTRPSFASLLTGRYASSHGVMSKAASLPDEATTLAEAFGAGGYHTAGIVTNYNVAPFFNFAQGFDEYHYLAPHFLFGASDTSAKLSLLQILRRVDEKARAILGRSEPGSAYQDAETVNGEVARFLDQQKGAQPKNPWLLFVAYMDPHDPYYEHPYNGVGYSRAAHVKPEPSEAERLRGLYDGEISYWDEHFGKLVDDLKRRGAYDDLTIVVTADHGEEFMEHGGFWHGTTLYDEQLHVPLFLKLPRGERAGSVLTHWVESVDIMPTLLSLKQLPLPKQVQGIDLFRGKEQTFAEESHEGNVLKSLRLRDHGAALKLIRANAGNPRGLQEQELYRVDVDVREAKNLAAEATAQLEKSEAELKHAEEQAKTGALKAREVDLAMDKTAEDRLKALGYANE